MKTKILVAGFLLTLGAFPVAAQTFSPAVNAKKQPTEVQIKACADEFKVKGIQTNGYKDFMKNCLKRKTHPTQQ